MNKKNVKSTKQGYGAKVKNCEIIAPSYSGEGDSASIQAQYLLTHLQEQQKLLNQLSSPSEKNLEPDGKNIIGRFDCGVIELLVKQIDGEPNYVYGLVADNALELEFLIYSISREKLDKIELGKKYKIHWMETICFMEPFDHGFQRTYIAYDIAAVN